MTGPAPDTPSGADSYQRVEGTMHLVVGKGEATLFVLAEDDPLTLRGEHTLPTYHELDEARIGLHIRRQNRPTCHLRIWRLTFTPTSSRVESANAESF